MKITHETFAHFSLTRESASQHSRLLVSLQGNQFDDSEMFSRPNGLESLTFPSSLFVVEGIFYFSPFPLVVSLECS